MGREERKEDWKEARMDDGRREWAGGGVGGGGGGGGGRLFT